MTAARLRLIDARHARQKRYRQRQRDRLAIYLVGVGPDVCASSPRRSWLLTCADELIE